jgi:hypothetical protein
MSNLSSLGKFCGHLNIRGLEQIEYAPLADIDKNAYQKLISSNYNFQSDIPFLTGGWLSAPVLPTRQRWTEKERSSKHGPSYNQEVRAILPKMRPSISGEFQKMSFHRFLLRLTDLNGQKWLLGTLEYPFRFSANIDSAEQTTGLNNYPIRFISQTAERSTGFVPIF